MEKKLIRDIKGTPLIIRSYRNIEPLANSTTKILVATDAKLIKDLCEQENIPCEMTSDAHQSGTDRVNEVASRHDATFVLNLQGDEPKINTNDVKSLMESMESGQWDMGTLGFWQESNLQAYEDPNVVKITCSKDQRALYFSRSSIPYYRDQGATKGFWQHVGIYAFKHATIKKFCSLPVSTLEKAERLEQLRALEAGFSIYVHQARHESFGIDTEEDLERFRDKI